MRTDHDHPGRRRPARHELGQAIVNNAASHILLRQAPQAIDRIADAFRLTDGEQRYLLSCPHGHGLFVIGDDRFPLQVLASPAEHPLATSDPAELPRPRERRSRGRRLLPPSASPRDRRRHGRRRRRQPSPTALADIPPDYLALYQEAATELGMPWELLAAIGKVESDHGRNPASRNPNAAGADGPMQFLPATFAAYSWASGNPDPNIDNPRDAIYAAAAMLVDNNVRDNPRHALYAYNHSDGYVDEVLAWAAVYQSQSDTAAGEAALAPGAPTAAAAERGQLRARAARHPLPMGRRQPQRLRLLRPRPGRLRLRRHPAPAHRPGAIRRRTARPRRRAAPTRRPRLLRHRPAPRRPRRHPDQPGRDGRRPAHRRRSSASSPTAGPTTSAPPAPPAPNRLRPERRAAHRAALRCSSTVYSPFSSFSSRSRRSYCSHSSTSPVRKTRSAEMRVLSFATSSHAPLRGRGRSRD